MNLPDEGVNVTSPLDELVRRGAQAMLQTALEREVADFVERHRDDVDSDGRRNVVRNGRLPERTIVTGAGQIELRQPRVRDGRGAKSAESVTFTSKILPRYLRRSKNVDELIPWL